MADYKPIDTLKYEKSRRIRCWKRRNETRRRYWENIRSLKMKGKTWGLWRFPGNTRSCFYMGSGSAFWMLHETN